MGASRSTCIGEVSLERDGDRRAVGIMNVRQALDLPEVSSFAYSHPDPRKAAAGIFVSRQELEQFLPFC
jgi:hypothetical protein